MRIGTAALVLLLGTLVWMTWRPAPAAHTCYVCQRPIHAHSKTLAVAGGREHAFCCPACALSQKARITALTAFPTGAALSPDNAWVVRGSDVNMCVRTQELLGADKREADLRYDRCQPSVLAFAKREEAASFAAQHGGDVLRFSEVSVPR